MVLTKPENVWVSSRGEKKYSIRWLNLALPSVSVRRDDTDIPQELQSLTKQRLIWMPEMFEIKVDSRISEVQ